MHWFALTVKPQHEKAVAERLTAKALESYAPLYLDRRRWSDRVKTVELPLFPRYVFCRFSFEDRIAVLSTPSVQSMVSFGGKPANIPEAEIDAVRKLVGSGLPVAPWSNLQVGQRVRICEGPMSGVEGILSREKSTLRVVVTVQSINQSIAVEIARECVKAIDHARSGIASLYLCPASVGL